MEPECFFSHIDQTIVLLEEKIHSFDQLSNDRDLDTVEINERKRKPN